VRYEFASIVVIPGTNRDRNNVRQLPIDAWIQKMDVDGDADNENSDFMANDAEQEVASASTACDPLFGFL
jgi:hypothetical protein